MNELFPATACFRAADPQIHTIPEAEDFLHRLLGAHAGLGVFRAALYGQNTQCILNLQNSGEVGQKIDRLEGLGIYAAIRGVPFLALLSLNAPFTVTVHAMDWSDLTLIAKELNLQAC